MFPRGTLRYVSATRWLGVLTNFCVFLPHCDLLRIYNWHESEVYQSWIGAFPSHLILRMFWTLYLLMVMIQVGEMVKWGRNFWHCWIQSIIYSMVTNCASLFLCSFLSFLFFWPWFFALTFSPSFLNPLNSGAIWAASTCHDFVPCTKLSGKDYVIPFVLGLTFYLYG